MRRYLVVPLIFAVGCVSSSKYDDAVKKLKACQAESDECTKNRTADADAAKKKIDGLTGQVDDLTKDRDDQKAGRDKAEKDLAALQANLKATTVELDQLRKAHDQAEKRLAAFKALTAKFKEMIDSGKIAVQFRHGQMVLKLPAGILFASGKAELSKEGKEALAQVAKILLDFPDRRWAIAGHTDSQPLSGSKYKNNWELSTARALTVTEYLITQSVKPENLSASGFGEFDPVADNKTDEGRQQNRRIEIILVPNIEELPSLPEDSGTN